MPEPLRILMITHHRQFKTIGRPLVMARYLARRGHTITLISTADHNRARTTITQEGNVRNCRSPRSAVGPATLWVGSVGNGQSLCVPGEGSPGL